MGADVQTFYDNRSDTAVKTVTQGFVTMYTPKHSAGQYPAQVSGPAKTLTQAAGISPHSRKMLIVARLCSRLATSQNPPGPDGTDSFMSETGAVPMS